MRPQGQNAWAWPLVVLVVGALPAFFVVFNVVFTDVFGLAQRAWSLLYVLVAYLLIGAVVGLPRGARPAWVGVALVAPAFVILLWYTAHEPQNAGLHALVLLVALVGAWAGAFSMHRVRRNVGAPA